MKIDFFLGTFAFIFGMVFGSFFNVCIYRIPLNLSVSKPSSHCPSCKHTLSPLDLVPIFSWIFLKGKCRYCGEKISVRYAIVELVTAVLFVLVFLRFGYTWVCLAMMAFVSVLLIVSMIDINYQIIPDSVLIFGGVVGIISVIFELYVSWKSSLIGLAVVPLPLLIIYFVAILIYKKEALGFGDIKLMAVVGLFLGWKIGLLSLVLGIYLAGIYGIILLVFKKGKRSDIFAFGPFLCGGTLIALLLGNEILMLYFR